MTRCVVLSAQVHYILQEVVMGGMVLETNMNEIVAQVEVQNRLEKSEVRSFLSSSFFLCLYFIWSNISCIKYSLCEL